MRCVGAKRFPDVGNPDWTVGAARQENRNYSFIPARSIRARI